MNGEKKKLALLLFQSVVRHFIDTHIQRKPSIFRERAGEKHFGMQHFLQHCLKMVRSPKSVITTVLIHEKFTSKQKKEVRREATLLHNPVKSLPSKWRFSDSVDQLSIKNSGDMKKLGKSIPDN